MKKRIGFSIAIMGFGSALSACQSYPERPSRVLEIEGNYSSLADCVYVKIESQGAWRKEDLPSLKTTRLLRGDDKYAVARVEVSSISDNRARITMSFSPGIKGPNYYPDLFEKEFTECSLKR